MNRALSPGRRVLALAALLSAFATALTLAGPANASVTAVAITSPSPVAIYPVYDESRPTPQYVEVAGSATGSGPVRFWCDSVAPDGAVVNSNPLTGTIELAGGPFTASVRIDDLGVGIAGCRLLALPADGLPADLSPFTGPLLLRQADNPETIAAGPNAGVLSYFNTTLRQRASEANVGSIALCGLCGLAFAQDDRQSNWAWWTAAWLNGYDTDATRTAAMIDGRETFFAEDVRDSAFNGYASWPAITGRQVTYPSASGPGGLKASEAPVHCTTDPSSSEIGGTARLDPATCAAFVPSGVRFDRRYEPLDAGGRSWRVTDVIHSVDGRAHELALAYANLQGNLNAPAIQVPWAADPAFTPWADLPHDLGAPQQVPATIYTQFNTNKPTGFENPVGALVVGPGFVGATFDRFEDKLPYITLHYRRTVPAGGSVTIDQAVVTAPDLPATRALAEHAEAELIEPVDPPPPADDGGGAGVGEQPPATRSEPPVVVPPPNQGDTTKPVLSRLARTKAGFRATLSEPARLTIAISRRDAGRRAGKACKKPTRKLRKAKTCTRLTKIGSLTVAGRQGANAIAFKDKVGRRTLKAGAYQATFVARDAAGNASTAKTVRFTVKEKAKAKTPAGRRTKR
jgi:hypothetical protein